MKYCLKNFLNIEVNNILYENILISYYKIFKQKKPGTNFKYKRKRKLIVSMTSIPSRIDKSWITVESLLRQTYKPDKILLWLAEDEFKKQSIPLELIEQQKRGLQIRYCENLRSYKKFYFTVKENPMDYIVTVDDDMIYAEDMLEKLVKTYVANPGYIVCNRSHYVKKRNGKLCVYNRWIKYEDRKYISEIPTFHNFFIGCAGTLIPFFKMNKEVMSKELFLELSPSADDVWLNINAWISNIKTINTKNFFRYMIAIDSSSEEGLYKVNVEKRKNDEQIKKVLDYFKINIDQYI